MVFWPNSNLHFQNNQILIQTKIIINYREKEETCDGELKKYNTKMYQDYEELK